jgi:hypothetical protein
MTDPHRTEPDHSHPTDSTDHDEQPRGLLYISDVQALQRADRVSFHYDNRQGYIHAGLTTWPFAEPRIYTATQQRLFPEADNVDRRRRIDVDASIVGFDEHRLWHERNLPGATAYHMIHTARLDEVWRSIAAFLRVGDTLTLLWRADNATDVLAAAGLHRDELRISVLRGSRRFEFLLDVSVTTSNARMITQTRHS